ncbi:MAG: hypothetical protein GX268_10575 [Methanomicrobiales archaeon]|nr:hypothetical protein [Methanomicrobiales archaeon]
MAKLMVNLTCPSCGGALKVDEWDSFIICPFCGTASTTGSFEKEKTLQCQLRVSQKDAEERVKKWFSEGSLVHKKASDLEKTGKITETNLIYLPFWRMIGQGRAIVCGYNKVQSDNKTTIDYKESDVSTVCEWNGIACNADEIGVQEIEVPEGEVKAVDEEEVVVFDTSESVHDGIERAVCGIRDIVYNKAASGISNITFAKSFVSPRSFSKILYPFWIVRYSYQNCGYFAVIDGYTNDICSGRAPGDINRQISFGSLGSILTGVIGGILVYSFLEIVPQLETSSGEIVMLAVIVLLIIGMIIGGISYQTFRHGSEIIEGKLPGVNK